MLKNPLTGQEITNVELQSVSELVTRQSALEKHINELEEELGKSKESLREVSEQQLPEAMMALGLSALTTDDGSAVIVARFYNAKIPDDKKDLAFNWLRQNGHDDIIKRDIKCVFGKGQDGEANQVIALLRSNGIVPEDKTHVHPQTLKAFVKEELESGRQLPVDLFGVFTGNRAKITPAKKA